MRQRSVQLWLEVLNSFACSLCDCRAQEQSPRGSILSCMFHNPYSSFLEPRCMHCASEAVHGACKSFTSKVRWVAGGTWRIGSSYWMPELLNSNDCFFVGSTTDSITPKNGHVSHEAHVTAKSCCAPTCLFSIWCVQKASAATNFRVRSGANTCLLDGTCTQTYTRRQLC